MERGIELARRIGRPYLELPGLVHWATEMPRSTATDKPRSIVAEAHYSRQAIELARRHGWTDDPAFGVACSTVRAALALQGTTNEAEPWIQRAERNVRTETEPAASLAIRYVRGLLEQARGRDAEALAAFQAVEPLARQIVSPQYLLPRARAQRVHCLVPSARLSVPGSPWTGSPRLTATTRRSASPPRGGGSPRTTPAPPIASSPSCWPALFRSAWGSG